MSSSGELVLRKVETPLFWIGALTVAWALGRLVYRLVSATRVWVLGNGRLVSPAKLGKWAGEEDRYYRFAFRCFTLQTHFTVCYGSVSPQKS